jgi:hypothetical protein
VLLEWRMLPGVAAGRCCGCYVVLVLRNADTPPGTSGMQHVCLADTRESSMSGSLTS